MQWCRYLEHKAINHGEFFVDPGTCIENRNQNINMLAELKDEVWYLITIISWNKRHNLYYIGC